jgi:hypothetical protein
MGPIDIRGKGRLELFRIEPDAAAAPWTAAKA